MGRSSTEIIEAKGLAQISDPAVLGPLTHVAIEENPQTVADFAAGKRNATNFLVGLVMRWTDGKANPGLVRKMVSARLGDLETARQHGGP